MLLLLVLLLLLLWDPRREAWRPPRHGAGARLGRRALRLRLGAPLWRLRWLPLARLPALARRRVRARGALVRLRLQ